MKHAPLFDTARLTSALEAANLDALVIASRPNFIYLTGIYQQIEATFLRQQHLGVALSRFAEGGRLHIVPIVPWVDVSFVEAHASSSAPRGYIQFGLKGVVGGNVAGMNAAGMFGSFPEAIAGVLKEDGASNGRIGFENESLGASFLADLQSLLPKAIWVPAEGLLENVRMIKTGEEIRRIRKSAETMEQTYRAIEAALREGVTEWELANVARQAMLAGHAERIAFLDVGIAENSMIPHGEPTDRPLKNGDAVRFDGGVNYQGYVSDIGRSYVLGKASDAQRDEHEVSLRTFEKLTAILAPGLPVSELYRVHSEGLGDYWTRFPLPNFVSHGLGLEIHEPPYASVDNSTPLQPGMVINIEPGAWVPGKEGIFLENSFLITDAGCEALTQVDMAKLTR